MVNCFRLIQKLRLRKQHCRVGNLGVNISLEKGPYLDETIR